MTCRVNRLQVEADAAARIRPRLGAPGRVCAQSPLGHRSWWNSTRRVAGRRAARTLEPAGARTADGGCGQHIAAAATRWGRWLRAGELARCRAAGDEHEGRHPGRPAARPLRHSYAVLSLTAGAHYMQVSKWLGHEGYVTTLTISRITCRVPRKTDRRATPSWSPGRIASAGPLPPPSSPASATAASTGPRPRHRECPARH